MVALGYLKKTAEDPDMIWIEMDYNYLELCEIEWS